MEPDEALMLRYAREGDRAALDELVRRHHAIMYQFIAKRVRAAGVALGEAELSEIVQNTWVSLIQGAHRYDVQESASFKTYLYTIAARRTIDRLRSFGRARARAEHPSRQVSQDEAKPSTIELVPDPSPGAEAQLVRGDVETRLMERVQRELESIPDEQREAFLLHYVQELSIDAIAQLKGVPHNTVKSRLRLVRERLRKAITGQAQRVALDALEELI